MRDPSFEQKKNLFTQRYFVPGLVEIGPVVLEKICKVFQCIFTILYYLLSESGVVLPLTKLEFPLPRIQRCIVESLVEIGHVLLEKKKLLKNLKRQQRRLRRWTTDEF